MPQSTKSRETPSRTQHHCARSLPDALTRRRKQNSPCHHETNAASHGHARKYTHEHDDVRVLAARRKLIRAYHHVSGPPSKLDDVLQQSPIGRLKRPGENRASVSAWLHPAP